MEEPVPGCEVLRIPASRENVYASYVLARSGQSVPHADLEPGQRVDAFTVARHIVDAEGGIRRHEVGGNCGICSRSLNMYNINSIHLLMSRERDTQKFLPRGR